MKPVDDSEIRALPDYERGRDEFRKHILAIKEPRRVTVGNHVTFLFENRDTVLYQIREMLRVERITDPTAIAHEVVSGLISGSRRTSSRPLTAAGRSWRMTKRSTWL